MADGHSGHRTPELNTEIEQLREKIRSLEKERSKPPARPHSDGEKDYLGVGLPEAPWETTENFRKIFHINPNLASVSTAEKGRFLDVNRAFEEVTGYAREEVIGKTAYELGLWRRKDVRDRIGRLIQDQVPIREQEVEIVAKTGEIKTLLFSADPIELTEEKCLLATAQDITERKKIQEAYLAIERNFREAFAHAPIGMVITDLKGDFLHVNAAYCRITGYSEEELLRPGHGLRLHTQQPENLADSVENFDKLLRGEIPSFFVEKRYRRKNGALIWVRASATIRRDAEGHPFQVVGLVEDITANKEAQNALQESREELRKAKDRAEAASRAKGEFLANMSHEIRTPMTVFMAALEHLLQIDKNPERRHLLGMAEQAARRLRTLIDDILDFSRLEAQRVEIEQEAFPLRDCLADAVGLFALPARKKNLNLETEVSPEIPDFIIGDAGRLGQVLINLIGNALKFTAVGEVRVQVQPRGDFLEFEVADTGIGIPEDKLHLLFQSFSQADSSFHRKFGGSGLGLAISKGLVELMGGRISARNRERGGSVFTFTLPLKPTAKAGSEPAASSGLGKGQRHDSSRILLAEDDPLIRKLIITILAKRNWQSETAETGTEALQKWEEGNFDLILMDLQMPEMDGLEATRTIRGREAEKGEKRTFIIGLTAHAHQEIKAQCLAAGMDRVLTKPLQIKELYSVIAGALSA